MSGGITDHLVVKYMISNSKLLSFTLVHVSNKIIKKRIKREHNLQTKLEAEKVSQQGKRCSKHKMIYIDGSASGRPEKGLPNRLGTRTH